MAITVRDSIGSNNGNGGTSITMTLPTNVDNDILVMHISVRGGTGTTITTPSGWDLLATAVDSTTVLKQAVYTRTASTEPASYAVTITSNKASGTITSLQGASTTMYNSSSVNASSATVTAATLGSFSSSSGVDLFLSGTAIGTTVLANPSNYILGSQAASTGAGVGTRTTSAVFTRLLTNITTVGSLTHTYNAAAVNIGHHLFIVEAVATETIFAFLMGG